MYVNVTSRARRAEASRKGPEKVLAEGQSVIVGGGDVHGCCYIFLFVIILGNVTLDSGRLRIHDPSSKIMQAKIKATTPQSIIATTLFAELVAVATVPEFLVFYPTLCTTVPQALTEAVLAYQAHLRPDTQYGKRGKLRTA